MTITKINANNDTNIHTDNEYKNEYKNEILPTINQLDNEYNRQIFNQKWSRSVCIDIDDNFFDSVINFKIGENLIFTNIHDIYTYIKSKSYFDGTYWNFELIKDTYKIVFVMRTIELIYETIYNYHTIKII